MRLSHLLAPVVAASMFLIAQAQVQTTTNSSLITTSSPNVTFATTSAGTTDAPNPCVFSYTCDQCVKVTGAKCYYCNNNSTNQAGCHLYPAKNVFPSTAECPLADARWGVCWVNFEALIISMSVIAGLLLISCGTALYCCCCRRKNGVVDSTELRWERETTERTRRHADRRAEREAKMSTIRQKYGLNRDTAAYDRMA